MIGITSLMDSRKAIVAISLIISATVMGALGYLNAEQWLGFAKWIGMSYMGAEALDSGLGKIGQPGKTVAVESKPVKQKVKK